jgi:hypothetical protein
VTLCAEAAVTINKAAAVCTPFAILIVIPFRFPVFPEFPGEPARRQQRVACSPAARKFHETSMPREARALPKLGKIAHFLAYGLARVLWKLAVGL